MQDLEIASLYEFQSLFFRIFESSNLPEVGVGDSSSIYFHFLWDLFCENRMFDEIGDVFLVVEKDRAQ